MTLIERLRHHAAHPAYHPYGPVFAEAAEAIRDRDAEIERLRKDAARYRWLRHGCDERWSRATHIAANYYGSEWDAAIDAAMKGE